MSVMSTIVMTTRDRAADRVPDGAEDRIRADGDVTGRSAALRTAAPCTTAAAPATTGLRTTAPRTTDGPAPASRTSGRRTSGRRTPLQRDPGRAARVAEVFGVRGAASRTVAAGPLP